MNSSSLANGVSESVNTCATASRMRGSNMGHDATKASMPGGANAALWSPSGQFQRCGQRPLPARPCSVGDGGRTFAPGTRARSSCAAAILAESAGVMVAPSWCTPACWFGQVALLPSHHPARNQDSFEPTAAAPARRRMPPDTSDVIAALPPLVGFCTFPALPEVEGSSWATATMSAGGGACRSGNKIGCRNANCWKVMRRSCITLSPVHTIYTRNVCSTAETVADSKLACQRRRRYTTYEGEASTSPRTRPCRRQPRDWQTHC